MVPVLVTPPTGDVVDLADLRLHLRLGEDETDQDELIAALSAAAVAYLDGWGGVLGRAILEQTWSVELDIAAAWVLPMPDVSAATVDYGEGPSSAVIVATAGGAVVETTGSATVAFTCAMADGPRAIAQIIVKMLVDHWYWHSGAVSDGASGAEIPLSASSLIDLLRVRRV